MVEIFVISYSKLQNAAFEDLNQQSFVMQSLSKHLHAFF